VLLRNLGSGMFAFWCPGCECYHSIRDTWSIVEDEAGLTIRPSVLTTCENYFTGVDYKNLRCHLFITNSKIEYLNDCDHKLSGITVEMVDTETLNY